MRLCRERQTNLHLCVKVLNKRKVIRLRQLDHVQSEKGTLAKAQHPFIVHLYGTYQDRTNLYLFLEYAPGGELFNLIRHYGKLSEEVTRFYTAEIVIALEYLHSIDIIYR